LALVALSFTPFLLSFSLDHQFLGLLRTRRKRPRRRAADERDEVATLEIERCGFPSRRFSGAIMPLAGEG